MIQNSTCFFEVNQENDKEKILQATITIINATDITVSASIHGSMMSVLDTNMDSIKKINMFMNKVNSAKTFTVIYKHNSTQTQNRKFNLGQRQLGDKQLYFDTRNVTIGFRFAEKEFKYNDPSKFITAIGFSMEVSAFTTFICYICI